MWKVVGSRVGAKVAKISLLRHRHRPLFFVSPRGAEWQYEHTTTYKGLSHLGRESKEDNITTRATHAQKCPKVEWRVEFDQTPEVRTDWHCYHVTGKVSKNLTLESCDIVLHFR